MLPVGEEIETASQSILAVTPHCHMVSLLNTSPVLSSGCLFTLGRSFAGPNPRLAFKML